MRAGSLIGLTVLVALGGPVEAAGPEGVWVSASPHSRIERIHISGSKFSYTATVDYRCFTGICSTLESLFEDDTHSPPLFSVPLENLGPAPIVALRWQSGPPCNRARSNENPLAVWANATVAPSGATQIAEVGHPWCFVRPRAPR
jgi:hypothetical protein